MKLLLLLFDCKQTHLVLIRVFCLLNWFDVLLSDQRFQSDPCNVLGASGWVVAEQIRGYLDTNNSPKKELERSQANLAKVYLFPTELLELHPVPDSIAATLEKQTGRWKRSQCASPQSAVFSKKGFFCCFVCFLAFLLEKPESVRAGIWRRVVYKGEVVLWQLAGAEWQMLLQTSAAGRHHNRTIPLIWHLIPLSTRLQPLSMHSVLIMKTHLCTISLGGVGKGGVGEVSKNASVHRLRGAARYHSGPC